MTESEQAKIRFHCPECKKSIVVAPETGGKPGKCPQCDAWLRVPNRKEPEPTVQSEGYVDLLGDIRRTTPPHIAFATHADARSSGGQRDVGIPGEGRDLFPPLPVKRGQLEEEMHKLILLSLKDSTCWFCGREPTTLSAIGMAQLYWGSDTRSIASGTHVNITTWRTKTVCIPRCSTCMEKHEKEQKIRSKAMNKFALPAAIIIGPCMLMGFWSDALKARDAIMGVVIVGSQVLWLLALGLFVYLTKAERRKLTEALEGTLPFSTAKSHPQVQELMATGLDFTGATTEFADTDLQLEEKRLLDEQERMQDPEGWLKKQQARLRGW